MWTSTASKPARARADDSCTGRCKCEVERKPRVVVLDDAVVLLARRFRVVAQRLHAVGDLAPGALGVVALVEIHRPAVARNADLVAGVELADDVRALAEARLAQHLHDGRAVALADLDDGAQLLVEKRGDDPLARAAGELLVGVALEGVDVVGRRVESDAVEVDGDAAM